jgi:hypothetical protein
MSSLSSSVPSLHPLKSWSLRQTRRGSITARAIAVAIATGTYRSATAPQGKTARRRHDEVGKREREEIARRSRTAPKIAASAAPDDQIALPAPMLGIPRPTRPTEIKTK